MQMECRDKNSKFIKSKKKDINSSFLLQFVDKVNLLLTTFLFDKKCDIMNVRVIIHSQQMHCQYSLFLCEIVIIILLRME